ncbi:hypothetical protein ANCCAN_13463, partial [Ancylostoma caninum]
MSAVFIPPSRTPSITSTKDTSSIHRSASTSSTLTDVISEELFPKFSSADEDWKDFGYLLDAEKDAAAQTSTESISQTETLPGSNCTSRGSGPARIADVNRPRPVAINPAEISLGGDVLDDWAKDSKANIIKEEEKDQKELRDGNGTEKTTPLKEEPVEESNAVADWEPSRKGPALSSPPMHKRRVGSCF